MVFPPISLDRASAMMIIPTPWRKLRLYASQQTICTYK